MTGLPRNRGPAERSSGLDRGRWRAVVAAALAEDLAGGTDVTTARDRPAQPRRAELTWSPGRPASVAGLPVAEAVFVAHVGR